MKAKKVGDPFPGSGLMFPKRQEKPPFQTWTEIERRITAGGLTAMQIDELWNSLFLTKAELQELLRDAKLYPTP